MSESQPEPGVVAVTGLMQSPFWGDFESHIRTHREDWLKDTRDPRVYQNHAELTHTMARVAECDWLLDLFDTCRKRITDPAG